MEMQEMQTHPPDLENNTSEDINLAWVLAQVGDYGKFQKLLTLLLLVMCVPMAYPVIIMYFSSFEPSWRCAHAHNSSLCNFNETFSSDTLTELRCSMNRSDWEYTKPKTYSFVTQFDANCDNKWKVDLVRSASFAGWGIGSILMGWLGDKYGRKILLLPSMIITLLVTLITPFLPNIYLLVVVRFFACFFLPGTTLSAFILITELVGEKWKVFAGSMVYLSMPLGYTIIVCKFYFIEGWRWLGVACSVPYVFLFAFYPFLPESLQWLSSRGRSGEVESILTRVAHWNGTKLPQGIDFDSITKEEDAESEADSSKTSFLDIFRTRTLAIGTLINGYLWEVVGLAYYGLMLASQDLGWTVHWSFFIMSVMDMMALGMTIPFVAKVGCRKGTLIAMSVGGILCMIVGAIPRKGAYLVIRLSSGLLGKFMMSISFNTICLWTIQLYSTATRAKGMGWAQINGHVGSTLAPWIHGLFEHLGTGAPFLALGAPVIAGMFLAMKLPEWYLEKTKARDDAEDKKEIM